VVGGNARGQLLGRGAWPYQEGDAG
jgi:hypothetical protein